MDFNLIDRARTLFAPAFPTDQIPATWHHGNRTFSIQDYLGFMLLGLDVPTCDTLRGLCKASELEQFKKRYGCFTMDLASVSKAQAHVPEEMLLPIIAQLGGEVQTQARQMARHGTVKDPQTTHPDAAQLGKYALRVVDRSVFAALPKMTWALFGAGKARKDGRKTASVRFHVSLDPFALCPLACAVTSATVDEKRMWSEIRGGKSGKQKPQRPSVEVGDRNFGSNYDNLSQLTDDGVNFVVRMKEAAHMEVGHWLAESEKGVRIQLYLVMILALLLQLQTGTRPTKRMIELLQFYVQGLASETELLEGLKARAREADLARESSRKRYLAKKQAARK